MKILRNENLRFGKLISDFVYMKYLESENS